MRNQRTKPLFALILALLHVHIILFILLQMDSSALLLSKKYISMLVILQAAVFTWADTYKPTGYRMSGIDYFLVALEPLIGSLFHLNSWQWIICIIIKGFGAMASGSTEAILNRHIFASLANAIPAGGYSLYALYKLWIAGAPWLDLLSEFGITTVTLLICFGVLVFLANAVRNRWAGGIRLLLTILVIVWVVLLSSGEQHPYKQLPKWI